MTSNQLMDRLGYRGYSIDRRSGKQEGDRSVTVSSVVEADHMSFADGPENVRMKFREHVLRALSTHK